MPLAILGCEDTAEGPTATPPPLPTTNQTPENSSLPPTTPQLQLRATFDSFYPMQLDYAVFYSDAQPAVTPLLSPSSTLHEAVELYGKMLTGNFFVRYCEDAQCAKVTAIEKATVVTPLPAGITKNEDGSYAIKPTAKMYDAPLPLYPEFTLSVSSLPQSPFYADLFFDTAVGTPCKTEAPVDCATLFDTRPTALSAGGRYDGEPPTLSVFNPKAHRPFLVQARSEGITTVQPLFHFSHIVGLLECNTTISCLSQHAVASTTPSPDDATTPETKQPPTDTTAPATPAGTATATPVAPTDGKLADAAHSATPAALEPAPTNDGTDTAATPTTPSSPPAAGEPTAPTAPNDPQPGDDTNAGTKKPTPGIDVVPPAGMPPSKLPRAGAGTAPKAPKRAGQPGTDNARAPTGTPADDDDDNTDKPPRGGTRKPPIKLDPTTVGRIGGNNKVPPPSILKVLLDLDLARAGQGPTRTGSSSSSSSSGGQTEKPSGGSTSSSTSSSGRGGEAVEPMIFLTGTLVTLLPAKFTIDWEAVQQVTEAIEKEKAEAQAKAKAALEKVQQTVEDLKNNTDVKTALNEAKGKADEVMKQWVPYLQTQIANCTDPENVCSLEIVKDYIEKVKSQAGTAKMKMDGALGKFNAVKAELEGAIAEAQSAVETAMGTVQSAVDEANQQIDAAMQEINNLVSSIQGEIASLKQQFEETITNTLSQIASVQKTVEDAIASAAKEAAKLEEKAKKEYEAWKKEAEDAWGSVKEAASGVKDTFDEIVGSFGGLGDLF
ncbi:MAG: hypothetical protein HY696_03345 [Deltaproteobacteria bacterium]|nr:hypothetical protein [Deltaproteobacteria bacterium]